MAEFRMPSLGADMEAGTLIAWSKKPGDVVERGDIVAEVETEKGIIEVEVFSSGVLERWLVSPGTKVPVGTPLAIIRDDDSAAESAAPSATVPAPAPLPSAAPPPPSITVVAHGPAPTEPVLEHLLHRKASPAARRRARQLDMALETITGTGPHGSITVEDVERAARTEAPPGPAPSATLPAPRGPEPAQLKMRQAIAAAVSRSKREIPHYYVATTVDLTAALDWLEQRNRSVPPAERLIPGALYLKAVALGLRAFPELNGRWENGALVLNPAIHVGSAISLRSGGLVAPALPDTDRSPLPELMARLRDIVGRARAGGLRSSEFNLGTITVTSLGDRGTDIVYGVIYPPQVAIVGFGRIVERPWVVAGSVVPRRVVSVTLAADHRVSDGHRGALFLEAIERLLQAPEAL